MYKGFYCFLAISFLWYIMYIGVTHYNFQITLSLKMFFLQMPDKLLILKYLNGSSLSVILSRNY